ncbi:MAG: ribonuclease III [Patescibacteria group bacterium]|nr:ribonuclease III [Patescibacteria group bacterium]
MSDLSLLEKSIGVEFKDKNLLKKALTHRSYLNENPNWPMSNNERLEYLGDAVLELVVTEYLYEAFADYQEGQLTSLRAALVNYQILSQVAKSISLDRYIFLSKGEAKDTGKARDVILANAIEALFGAVYLDRGYVAVKKVVKKIVLNHLNEIIEKRLYRDSKSLLQEIIQDRLKITPIYEILRQEGPDHQKKFTVGVFFGDKLIAEGDGTSKQEAESHAAEHALKELIE